MECTNYVFGVLEEYLYKGFISPFFTLDSSSPRIFSHWPETSEPFVPLKYQQYSQQNFIMHPTTIILTGLSLLACKTFAASISLGTGSAVDGLDGTYAWVGGANPCTNADSRVRLGDLGPSPCGTRFALGGMGGDLHFEGCGGPL